MSSQFNHICSDQDKSTGSVALTAVEAEEENVMME